MQADGLAPAGAVPCFPRSSTLRRGLAAALAALGCATGWAQAPAAVSPHTVPDTMAQRMQACTGCHGPQGQASAAGYLPRLAGKPAGYLYHQLRHFREGRRQNAGMTALLDPLSDAYLREIAAHFAGLNLPYPPPEPPAASRAVLAQGEALVRRGDAARQLPACASCHGELLTGREPDVPGLLGLPRDYLIAQLGAWQTGMRHAFAPDCMAELARRLAPTEVSALASWLAAQPLPPDTRPASPWTGPPPMDCGRAPEAGGMR